MKKRALLIVFLLLLIVSCTRYVYHGSIVAEDSNGDMKKHLIYWTKTDRLFWFDECSGTISLLTESSIAKVDFDEREDGIYYFWTKNQEGATHSVKKGELCGKIMEYRKIAEIEEGILLLEIYCKYVPGELSDPNINNAYLKAREQPYEFKIIKEKSSKYEDGVPKPP